MQFMCFCFVCGAALGSSLRGDTPRSKMLNGPGLERPSGLRGPSSYSSVYLPLQKKKNMLVDNCSLRLGRWEENAAMQRILFTASKDSFHTDCAP